jgi:hypothetical protein
MLLQPGSTMMLLLLIVLHAAVMKALSITAARPEISGAW